ncbi:hypothetical protein B7P43_G09151 [Cryptotermes secundus]|uniref:Bardet-Biedl syndrome 10 protein n=1 Tax=Cryptotermes secundus TaxID=105785 RepID=A0A2J7Q8Q7_9NEOP|nr:hypothetical protein B7P43_G09151 [Cryptotermes secundus]PNF24968.1 hypothetical protein B7P43_G09151 [Cryptotermes secundus]PNF24969.1 hypothetical protein B7P43_G09151 [Cryptotermes secundus]PNF24970.1 hypothetical protein B7P43_G09151 [Cryptotermes secundus]PNF24971.1 hypothetical protein B7P43_G09151 [Cryptotermes secundus]
MCDSVSSAEELEQLVAIAFGPEGRAVMVQQPTGQFTITRSGHSILTSIYPEPDPKQPAQHMLIDCARRVHESLGDGVKSFIIMTSSLLKYCKSLDNPTDVARQLGMLGRQLSSFQCQRTELPAVNDSVLTERIVCFETVIQTFFSTRFPAPVCNSLSSLLCQWIQSNTGSALELKMQSYSQRTLQTLLKDFSVLCQYKNGGSRPVSDSFIRQGSRLCRPAINLSVSGPCRIHFLMLGDSDSPGSGCFDDIDIQSEVERFLNNLRTEGCEYERILLVTSAILSDLTLFRLRSLNIAVLQGILPEEVNYIYTAMFPLQREDSRETVINVKPEVDCTWLEIPNIYQLILHAPTSELSTEYACSCQSAIKLCIVAASHALMPNFSPCVTKVGGSFEKALQMHLAVESGKSLHDPLSCGVANRAELMEWHKQYRAVSQNSQSTVSGSDTCRRDSRSQVENLGTGATVKTEAINEHTLSATSLINIPNFNDLHDTFSKMTLLDNATMDQVLWHVSKACAGLDADVMGALVKTLLAVQRRLPHSHKMKQNSGLEPVGLKLCILQHSLCATASLLRISGILQVKKKLPS